MKDKNELYGRSPLMDCIEDVKADNKERASDITEREQNSKNEHENSETLPSGNTTEPKTMRVKDFVDTFCRIGAMHQQQLYRGEKPIDMDDNVRRLLKHFGTNEIIVED